MVDPIPVHLTKRIRSACDRCHSQKLRCRKLPDNGQCARCTKAQAPCVFSPANRGFRANPKAGRAAQDGESGLGVAETSSSSLSSSSSEDGQDSDKSPSSAVQTLLANEANIDGNKTNSIDLLHNSEYDPFTQFEDTWNLDVTPNFLPDLNDFDMERLDFSLADDFAQSIASFPYSPPETLLINNIPASPTNSIKAPSPVGVYIHQLSTLSINLYELAATVPPPPGNMETSSESVARRAERCKNSGGDFQIDKIFTSTQNLLSIMDDLFPRSPSSHPFYDAFHIPDIDEQAQSRHLVLDPATMLLVVSCYLRLLDIFEVLLEYTKLCMQKDNLLSIAAMPMASMPSKMIIQCVKIGSFQADNTMTASIAILQLFMGLSRQLLDRMRGIASIMGYSDGSDDFVTKTGHAEVTQTVFRSAEKRTLEASQKFSLVRTQLFQLGVL